jgi:hypothetical protein
VGTASEDPLRLPHPQPLFPYSAAAVPIYSETESRSAEQFIGDYAPIGVYVSEEDFANTPVRRFFQ